MGRTDRAMEKRADQKTGWYNRLVLALVVQKRLVPLIFCTTGRLSSDGTQVIEKLTREFDSSLRPIVVHLGAIVALFNAKTVLFNHSRLG
ncbi:hypothetical protein EON65_31760 [archaeon]|nr:MAG: hypothetical protein EON65_31760 [archaeon]